jgi:hypothetical protein
MLWYQFQQDEPAESVNLQKSVQFLMSKKQGRIQSRIRISGHWMRIRTNDRYVTDPTYIY